MELEELRSTWQTVNRRLDEIESVQTVMQRDVLHGQTKNSALRLRVEPIFELIVAGATAVWSGNFLADNFAKIQRFPLGAIPVCLLDAMAIFTIWLSIRQLIVIATLDYADSVVESQKKIATLKSLRVRSTHFMMLAGLPLWIIFPIIAGQALINFDFLRAVDPTWIVVNLAFGVLASLGLIFAARKYGEQSRFFQKLNDILAGTEIARAQKLLSEVSNFANV